MFCIGEAGREAGCTEASIAGASTEARKSAPNMPNSSTRPGDLAAILLFRGMELILPDKFRQVHAAFSPSRARDIPLTAGGLNHLGSVVGKPCNLPLGRPVKRRFALIDCHLVVSVIAADE